MAEVCTQATRLKGKVDFGIITIREDEFQAVLDRLPTEETVVGRQRYAISKLRTISDDEYLIASVRCLEQGTNQAQEVARTLIDELDPQWILIVGIAGSVPDFEYTIGDVLLASRLHDYSVSALIEGTNGEVTQEFTDMGGPMHQDVQSLLAFLPAIPTNGWWQADSVSVPRPDLKLGKDYFYGDDEWSNKVKACLKRYAGKKSIRNHPKAFAGSVVSSGILLKDTQTAKSWLKSSRDIKGIEMELAGVYRAAARDQKPVLAIRGISDIVGYKRSPEWTSYACNTAAAYMEALLRSRPITPLEAKKDLPDRLETPPILGESRPVGIFRTVPENPAPLARKEKLFSNLLEVSYFPKNLHVLETDCKDPGEVWANLKLEDENPPCDWFYKRRSIYAFHDFRDPIWRKLRENHELSKEETSHWADSEDKDRIAEFIELLRNCLKQMIKDLRLRYIHKQRVKGESKKFSYIYFEATTEFTGGPFVSPKDLIDIDKLVSSLKSHDTPFLKHVFSHLSSQTRNRIERASTSPENLRNDLVTSLNEVIKQPFYDQLFFKDIRVRWEALNILKKDFVEDAELTSLNRMLLEDGFRGLIQRRILRGKGLAVKSLVKVAETEVFKPVFTKSGNFSYYRHHAFRPEFRRLGGRWFLEITPTYHYTWDGFHVSYFYEDLVSGIKKIERSGAVFRQVLFWSRILQEGKTVLLEQRDYPYLKFGDLLEYLVDHGIREELWLNREISVDGSDPVKRRRQGRRKSRAYSNDSQTLFGSYES